jgi:hypothetical protein
MWFTRSGSARNFDDLNQDYERRVPLLSYFDLRYEKLSDPTAQLDNNLRGLGVLPDTATNTLAVAMFDKEPTSASDRFKYTVRSYGADAEGIIQDQRTSQPGVTYPSQTVVQVGPRPANSTLVLVGFSLKSTHRRDYQMKALGAGSIKSVQPNFDSPKVVFDTDHSFNDDGQFFWELRYAWVPNRRFLQGSPIIRIAKGHGTGSLATAFETPPLGYVPVICGIYLNYSADAHHKIRRIAAGNVPDTLNFEFAFHDKNADDAFGYEMAYAFLKEQ